GDDTVVVAAGQWDTVESWAAARKLAAIRELIRRRPAEGYEPAAGRAAGADEADRDGLPDLWRRDLAEEVALELAISTAAADGLISLAWTLGRRLPLTAAALDAGILNLGKARMIARETSVLSDADARRAEELAAAMWAGKSWGQIHSRILRAVVEVDPCGSQKRREQAEREEARVRFWREQTGTAAIAGYALPADRALEAMASVQNRARAYKRHGIPENMQILRVMAMLDLLTGADSRTRYPRRGAAGGSGGCGPGDDGGRGGHPGGRGAGNTAGGDGPARGVRHDGGPEHNPASGSHGDDSRDEDDPDDDRHEDGGDQDSRDDWDDDGPGNDGPGDHGDDGGPQDGGGPRDGPGGTPPDRTPPDRTPPGGAAAPGEDGGGDGLAANVELTIPLATLLGLGERPGEAHGLGVLDPALARQLAAAAARNPRSRFEIILTGPHGHAIGYGRAVKRRQPRRDTPPPPGQHTPGGTRDNTGMAAFTPAGPGTAGGPTRGRTPGHDDSHGGGYGAWDLRVGDLEFTVTIVAIPGGECDHRYETKGYRPSETLRRLVQVRDGQCTLPVCVRHPRNTDFEHAIPWPAGRSCLCNAGCRCRHCHRVKQAKGWAVEQLPGGRHQWTTPSGKQYTKGPKEYPI
ncbi:MAG: DUF222 domain-containing protein, partial [Streptosporangiaceae bacterium]|nr:DUF222 domain-containing protein [Streptosporangiaceae bacterium]